MGFKAVSKLFLPSLITSEISNKNLSIVHPTLFLNFVIAPLDMILDLSLKILHSRSVSGFPQTSNMDRSPTQMFLWVLVTPLHSSLYFLFMMNEK